MQQSSTTRLLWWHNPRLWVSRRKLWKGMKTWGLGLRRRLREITKGGVMVIVKWNGLRLILRPRLMLRKSDVVLLHMVIPIRTDLSGLRGKSHSILCKKWRDLVYWNMIASSL